MKKTYGRKSTAGRRSAVKLAEKAAAPARPGRAARPPRSPRRVALAEQGTAPAPAIDTAEKVTPTQRRARGSSGTKIYAGYFAEEYLPELRGRRGAEERAKMLRSDGQVTMLVSAVTNPILAAKWEVDPGAQGEEYEADAELVRHILFEDRKSLFPKFLGEAARGIVGHGHSLHEVTHKVVVDHPTLGSYIGILELGFRAQDSIEQWNLDPADGRLLAVRQISYGDLQRSVDIPGEYLLVTTLNGEGDNHEGIALVRGCYGAWLRKQLYLKLMAIGMEKAAVPTPIAKVPPGKQNTEDYDNLIEVLENYESHESGWISIPQGWDLDLHPNQFDPEKCIKAVEFEDKQMTRAFVANFLELGMSGGGGSYSLALNQNDFFEAGVEQLAHRIASVVNERLIPQLVKLNRGPRDRYPELKHSGIRDKVGKELGELLSLLAQTQYITPDDPTEVHLRKRLSLPPLDKNTARKVKAPEQQTGEDKIPTAPGAPPRPGAVPTTLAEAVRLAEKPKAVTIVEKGKDELSAIMREQLSSMGKALVADVMRAARASTPAEKPTARRGVEVTGTSAYRSQLVNALASIATRSLEQARREVPKKKSVRLAGEPATSVKLGEFEKLPTRVQKKIASQADLITETHAADLQRAVFFAYDHAEGSTDSDSILENDLWEAAERVVDSAGVETAASNVAALVSGEARNSFFFDDEVVKGIASFTFVNPDPKSPICEDLAGSVFRVDDPEAWRYFPPLHHNCKSIWVPNPIGLEEEPDITGLKPSKASLEKYITLHEVAARPRSR